jgi:hypothetical protein
MPEAYWDSLSITDPMAQTTIILSPHRRSVRPKNWVKYTFPPNDPEDPTL